MELTVVNVDMTEEGKDVFKLIGGFELAYGFLLKSKDSLTSRMNGAVEESLNMQVKKGERTQKVANRIAKDRQIKFTQHLTEIERTLKKFLDSMDGLREENEEIADIMKDNLYYAADETFNI